MEHRKNIFIIIVPGREKDFTGQPRAGHIEVEVEDGRMNIWQDGTAVFFPTGSDTGEYLRGGPKTL